MNKFSALIWILIVCLGEFNNKNLIGARKHHHHQSISAVRRIHRPYEAWQSDGNGDGGGGSLSPWELSLISEILTEFGISACPAIETSGFDEFKQYLTEVISRARDNKVNSRFTEVYDGLTHCLENKPLEANRKDYQNQEDADGSIQTPEHGEESKLDASDTVSSFDEDQSTPLPVSVEGEASDAVSSFQEDKSTSLHISVKREAPVAPKQEQLDDDVESHDLIEASPGSSSIDELSSALPPSADLDESELPEEVSEEIGILEKASRLALQIYETAEELLSWFGQEKRGSGEFADDEDDSQSGSDETPFDSAKEMESVPLYYFKKVSPEYLEPLVDSSKAHFSDIFQRAVLIVANRCRAFQPRDGNFIQDAAFKILSLVYEDLNIAAANVEVLNVNEELQFKLRDCTK